MDDELQDLDVLVLGEIDVRVRGTSIMLGRQQQLVVAVLAAHRDEVVSGARLAEAAWYEQLPSDPRAALRSLVARLRKNLGAAAPRLVTEMGGYRLRLNRSELDAARFQDLVALGRCATGRDQVAHFDDALALWRGEAYGGFEAAESHRAAIALEEMRLAVREERAATMVQLGRSADAIADLEGLLEDHPHRDHARVLLIDALSAMGRPNDALDVYRRWDRKLAARGLEPSPVLRAAESRVLRHAGTAVIPRWRSMLPRPVGSLVGREAEVTAVSGLLEVHRLVTLVGVGGVGKTRLALAVADGVLDRFEDGLWFCDLSSAASPADVIDIVATTVGLNEQGSDPLVVQLARHFESRRSLIVLDNCERVTSGAAEVAEALTARTSDLVVLATSRQRLGADGEYVTPVGPLGTGGHDSPAARLFTERCRTIGTVTSATTAVELETVAELCRRLDGLPLAIELAAARTRAITPAELAAELRERPVLLVDKQRTQPRHRSLTALIDWSHDDLDERSRTGFRRLGVFRGSFTLDDAVGMLTETGFDAAMVPDVVVELVERSLLVRSSDGTTSSYRALDSIREYMLTQLGRAGETTHAMAAHARWAADFAERAEVGLAGPAEADWAVLVYLHVDDLRAAVDWSISVRGDEALRIVAALHLFAVWRSESEIHRWAERATAAGAPQCAALPSAFAAAASGAWQRGDLAAASRALSAGAGHGRSRRLYEGAGDLAILTGDLDEAAARYLEARDLAIEQADPAQAVWDEGSRALAYAYGQDERAFEAAERTMTIASGIGSPSALAYAHYVLAEAVIDIDPERARHHLGVADAAANEVGSTYLSALVGLSLANIAARTAAPADALGTFEQILITWQRTVAGTGLVITIRSLVTTLIELGDLKGAALLYGAVSEPKVGPKPYGDDADRLGAAERTLRDRLGRDFDELSTRGRSIHEDELATTALHHVRGALRAVAAARPTHGIGREVGTSSLREEPQAR
jgi:predicted ATPase/DNA-binding SARP family transcriptional activator